VSSLEVPQITLRSDRIWVRGCPSLEASCAYFAWFANIGTRGGANEGGSHEAPWSAENTDGGYRVRDKLGRTLCYIYCRDDEQNAEVTKVLTWEESRRVGKREVATGMLRMTQPIKVKHQGGFSLLDMKHFVETRGLQGVGYRDLTFEQLLTYPSAIVPVLQYGNPHFIVVRGLTSSGGVDIADPGFGNRTISIADFKSIWQSGIGFVVTR
jgi:hypothetical protein